MNTCRRLERSRGQAFDPSSVYLCVAEVSEDEGGLLQLRFADAKSENEIFEKQPSQLDYNDDALAESSRELYLGYSIPASASVMRRDGSGREGGGRSDQRGGMKGRTESGGGELKSRCMTVPGGFKNPLWQSALMRISWRKQRKRDSPTTEWSIVISN
ncbi:hypothetical protein PROFUN_08773 [Planoprotostelium fungivorum]|uniref:Uncharacterized protein n=1 Tax=Planoprotostelium fungivorum TaxID=1890364 RepID=A0A2P6MVQ1_9EUKA|nr:hypothetical protein PROFUN_08773 [Planoprotostelium fungivorum]